MKGADMIFSSVLTCQEFWNGKGYIFQRYIPWNSKMVRVTDLVQSPRSWLPSGKDMQTRRGKETKPLSACLLDIWLCFFPGFY